jgi:hypothetical protein
VSKHTPGPWEAQEYASPRGRWYVRQVGGLKTINYPLSNEANARLIAAAPELLKALEMALLYHRDDAVTALHIDVSKAARAAIAKATQP